MHTSTLHLCTVCARSYVEPPYHTCPFCEWRAQKETVVSEETIWCDACDIPFNIPEGADEGKCPRCLDVIQRVKTGSRAEERLKEIHEAQQPQRPVSPLAKQFKQEWPEGVDGVYSTPPTAPRVVSGITVQCNACREFFVVDPSTLPRACPKCNKGDLRLSTTPPTAQPTPAGVKTDREPFDLTQIPFDAERRVGKVFQEGERKYGRDNWRSGVGDRNYQLERANHALKHLKIYLHQLQFGEYLGEPGEDDLAKVAWFCLTQMELERLDAQAHKQH